MDKFRKLTDEEMKHYGVVERTNKFGDKCRDIAIKYFKSSHLIELVYSSEYNNNDYTNSILGMYVYDINGDELSPGKDHRAEARQEIANLVIPERITGDQIQLNEFILVDSKIPELYIKIN